MSRARRSWWGRTLTASALPAPASATVSVNSHQVDVYSALGHRFAQAALESGSLAEDSGWTDAPNEEIVEAVDVLASDYRVSKSDDHGYLAWLLTSDDATVKVTVGRGGGWSVCVAGEDDDRVGQVLDVFRLVFPEPVYVDTDTGERSIGVRFWALGAMGPFSYRRRLSVTPWDEAHANYPSVVQDQIDPLMAMADEPDISGRLMLWHGPAGTGKTNCLRAIADAWRDWCDVDYIVDADRFFESAGYMVEALIQGSDADRWRLVVIEDSGEYLRADAADRVGQGLSKLLNLTDGLVGQGLNLIVGMTTNEDIGDLHPAVTRPGRCMSVVEFGLFPGDEAEQWLTAHGVAPGDGQGRSLAQLYASLPRL